MELYQTRQEKSQYYTIVSASLNTVVSYDSKNIQLFGTINDVKSHKVDATWASQSKIFCKIDFTGTDHLYIVSDSPTSQYRNRKNAFVKKGWAVSTGIDTTWVFTESGHGKGPMDGVGDAIKRVCKDTICFHPNAVIQNTDQLLEQLPIMKKSSKDTMKLMLKL